MLVPVQRHVPAQGQGGDDVVDGLRAPALLESHAGAQAGQRGQHPGRRAWGNRT